RVQQALRDVDAAIAPLIESAERDGREVIVVSEYGITPVTEAVHINRALREAGLIAWRDEMGREVIDHGESRAFAVPDHQIAHIYVRDPADVAPVADLIASLDGVETVVGEEGKREMGLDHPRSG